MIEQNMHAPNIHTKCREEEGVCTFCADPVAVDVGVMYLSARYLITDRYYICLDIIFRHDEDLIGVFCHCPNYFSSQAPIHGVFPQGNV